MLSVSSKKAGIQLENNYSSIHLFEENKRKIQCFYKMQYPYKKYFL